MTAGTGHWRTLRAVATLAGAYTVAVLPARTIAAPLLQLLRLLRERGSAGLADQPFAELLGAVAGSVVLAAGGWLLLLSTAVVVETARTAEPGRLTRSCPASLRRVLVACCGAALVGGLSTTAASAEPAGHPHRSRLTAGASIVAGLSLPDRTVGSSTPDASSRRVRVRSGDSLWAIGSRLLGPHASDREIAALTDRMFDANRDRLGPDPDLILPATVLRVPDLPSSRKDLS